MAHDTSLLGIGIGGLTARPAQIARIRDIVSDHGGTVVVQSKDDRLIASSFKSFEPLYRSAVALAETLGSSDADPTLTAIRTNAALRPFAMRSLAAMPSGTPFYDALRGMYGKRLAALLLAARDLDPEQAARRLALVGTSFELGPILGNLMIDGMTATVDGIGGPIRFLELRSASGAPLTTDQATGDGGPKRGLGVPPNDSWDPGDPLSYGLGDGKVSHTGGSLGGPREETAPESEQGSEPSGPDSESGSGGSEPLDDRPGSEAPVPDRFLQARFARRVRLDAIVTLQARIGLESSASGASAKLKTMPIPPEGLKVRLILHSPGFDLVEGDEEPLIVPAEKASDWVPFRLRAVEAGTHVVAVSCYAPGGFAGEVEIETTIEPGIETDKRRDTRSGIAPRTTPGGEASLQVFEDDGTYSFQLIFGTQFEDRETLHLGKAPQAAIERLIGEVTKIAKNPHKVDPAYVRARLRAEGIQIWDELIPEGIKEAFWRWRTKIRALYIRGQNAVIPWELLYPFDAEADDRDHGFLADQFPVARRPFGRQHEGSIRVTEACFVKPNGSPAQADDEIRSVRDRVEASGGSAGTTVSDFSTLLETLNTGTFDLLHFACHNRVRMGDASTIGIDFEGSSFAPVFLSPLKGRLRKRAPLVVLNACRTTSEHPRYIEPYGWAHGFLKAGAGAFIGTLWEVRDDAAKLFAETFYRELLASTEQPRSIGDAFQAARRAIRDLPGDPTWLAYTFFGNLAANVVTETSS